MRRARSDEVVVEGEDEKFDVICAELLDSELVGEGWLRDGARRETKADARARRDDTETREDAREVGAMRKGGEILRCDR